jgi:hypothetical protein
LQHISRRPPQSWGNNLISHFRPLPPNKTNNWLSTASCRSSISDLSAAAPTPGSPDSSGEPANTLADNRASQREESGPSNSSSQLSRPELEPSESGAESAAASEVIPDFDGAESQSMSEAEEDPEDAVGRESGSRVASVSVAQDSGCGRREEPLLRFPPPPLTHPQYTWEGSLLPSTA